MWHVMRPARTILILARISLHSMCAQCSVSNVSRIQFRFVCTLHAHIMRELHTRDSYTTCSCIKPSITWNENSVALFSLSFDANRIGFCFFASKPKARRTNAKKNGVCNSVRNEIQIHRFICVCLCGRDLHLENGAQSRHPRIHTAHWIRHPYAKRMSVCFTFSFGSECVPWPGLRFVHVIWIRNAFVSVFCFVSLFLNEKTNAYSVDEGAHKRRNGVCLWGRIGGGMCGLFDFAFTQQKCTKFFKLLVQRNFQLIQIEMLLLPARFRCTKTMWKQISLLWMDAISFISEKKDGYRTSNTRNKWQ